MRIVAPTYTQTPNDLFDHWIPLLKESELKVLLIIIRKTFGWHKIKDKISLRQLAQFTGLTQETVVIATRSLQKKGIVKRQVVGKLGTQQTFYELIVEDSNNSYPSDDPSRPLGFNPLGESEQQKKASSIKEKQQQAEPPAPAAAASSKDEKEKRNPVKEPYFCLQGVQISQKQKMTITSKWSEEAVKKAVLWLLHPKTKITTTTIQALQWACAEQPGVPNDSEDQFESNKEFAMRFDEKRIKGAVIYALSKHVEIAPDVGQGAYIEYAENGFKEKFADARKKFGFR